MGSEEQQAEPDSEVKQWRISAAIWGRKYYIQVVNETQVYPTKLAAQDQVTSRHLCNLFLKRTRAKLPIIDNSMLSHSFLL